MGEVGEILGSAREGDLGFRRTSIFGVSTDSRTIKESELFVALKGANHDGHDYLGAAFAGGAIAAIVSADEARKRNLGGDKYFIVENTLYALGELARNYRKKMGSRVVAVTGSNGKTTVKNLIYEIISRHGSALRSEANFNNLVGVPLSIFQLRDIHGAAVFELGMSARGEIARLAEISSPDVAVITNVGPVHLEFLKSVEEVAAAKLEVLGHIRKGGVLIVNGDDERLARKLREISIQTIRFGIGAHNDVKPGGLELDGLQFSHFNINGERVHLRLPGLHNVYNALAAWAVASAMDIEPSQAAAAINKFHTEGMRSEVVTLNDVTLVIDCYNANPVSTKSALETLAGMECRGRRMAVLGDMLELGEEGVSYHEEIGQLARRLKIDVILGFGPLARHIIESFGDGGFHFGTKEGLINRLIQTVNKGDVILFKGSRGMALEEVVDGLRKSL